MTVYATEGLVEVLIEFAADREPQQPLSHWQAHRPANWRASAVNLSR